MVQVVYFVEKYYLNFYIFSVFVFVIIEKGKSVKKGEITLSFYIIVYGDKKNLCKNIIFALFVKNQVPLKWRRPLKSRKNRTIRENLSVLLGRRERENDCICG